jgi:hypothetical protein
MHWISDRYVITAGDVALSSFAGRAWSSERKAWETVSGTAMAAGRDPRVPLTLRGVDVRITRAAGGIVSGVHILLMVIASAVNTDQVIIVKDGIQSAYKVVAWHGKLPLAAGIQWRIHAGGIVANDVVSIGVQYE